MPKKVIAILILLLCASLMFACIRTSGDYAVGVVGGDTVEVDPNPQGQNSGEEPATDGVILSLAEAYQEGIITADQVRSIAYYHNGGKEWTGCECGNCENESYNGPKCYEGFKVTDYQPIPKQPEELPEGAIPKIKRCFFELINSEHPMITEQNITVGEYLGTYNGYAAVKVGIGSHLNIVLTEEVAGCVFYYINTGYSVVLWK